MRQLLSQSRMKFAARSDCLFEAAQTTSEKQEMRLETGSLSDWQGSMLVVTSMCMEYRMWSPSQPVDRRHAGVIVSN